MRILITGGAGFLGSHLCEFLLSQKHQVICIDNLVTGRLTNIEHIFNNESFTFMKHDVTNYIHVSGKLDAVLHFVKENASTPSAQEAALAAPPRF